MHEIQTITPRLELLGGFALYESSGSPVPLPTRKTEMLQAYLAMQPRQFHDRNTLAALFRNRSPTDQVGGSLRKALSALHQVVEPEILVLERGAVALAAGRITTDVDQLAARATRPAIHDLVPVREFPVGHQAPSPN